MKLSWKVYVGSVMVVGTSLLLVFLSPDQFTKGVGSIPLAGSLITILYQLLRDEASHRHQLEMQYRDHVFSLGITSKIAEFAFNKHVEFAERYIKEASSVFFKPY